MKKTMTVMASAVAASLSAVTLTVTNETSRAVVGDGTAIVPACRWSYDGYPADLGVPAFWFSADERDGWVFDENDPETVVSVPSLVGDGRSLTADPQGKRTTAALRSFDSVGPRLVTSVDALGGGPALDFGALGSGRGLFFDVEPGSVSEADPAGINRLSGVGTVVAVYDSSASGGWLMGGGLGGWGRGPSTKRYVPDVMAFDNAVFCDYAAAGYRGFVRHNGLMAHGYANGMAGTWEVISTVPTNVVDHAAGVGVGAGEPTSGGQKIAEMIVFDRVLSPEECEKAEAYLRKKWFPADAPSGVNGRSYLRRLRAFENVAGLAADGVRVEAAVPAGNTLELASLRGGRYHARDGAAEPAIVKTGDGTLEVGDGGVYGGKVELQGGTLAFPCRAIPSAPAVNCDFRFDASAVGAVVTEEKDGRAEVVFWRNENSSSATYRNEPVRGAYPVYAARRPVLVADALGEGKHAVDFGAYGADGAFLRLATNETAAAEGALPGLELKQAVTYVAVICPERGGGHVIDVESLRRNYGMEEARTGAIGAYTDISVASTGYRYRSQPQVYLDGAKWERTLGFENAGYQVVSVQSCGESSAFSDIAASCRGDGAGGMRIAELLVYRRTLSELEIRDTHAYLMAKWLSRTAPGYENVDSGVPDLQTVEVTAPSEIRVDRGSVRIRTLEVGDRLVKSGDGVLLVENYSAGRNPVVVKGGEIRIAEPADPASASEIAAAPSLRVDASDLASLSLYEVNGTNFVGMAKSADGRIAVYQKSAGHRPYLNPQAVLAGKELIDFGTFGSSSQTATGSRYMYFDQALDSVRSVFLVWGTHNGGGHVLGTASSLEYDETSDKPYDFICGSSGEFLYSGAAAYSRSTVLTNGIEVAAGAKRAEGYYLVEVHTDVPLFASALCLDRGSDAGRGGQRLAELVVYERELSEREKTATRNYLMKKWFGIEPDAENFPAKPDRDTGLVVPDSVSVDGESAFAVENDTVISEISGAGRFVKNGDGELSVKDVSSLSGILEVNEGRLKLTGVPLPYASAFSREGLQFHLDANAGVTEDGAAVTEWASTVEGSGKAVAVNSPCLLKGGLNGLDVVDMPAGGKAAFWFHDAEGARHAVSNMCTVLWVLGSQEGGGWLLGGGYKGYGWHRGKASGNTGDNGTSADDPMLDSSAAGFAKSGSWRLNGGKVAKPHQTPLSGGWDVVSYVCSTNSEGVAVPGDAHGLAMDSRSPGTNDRSGNQRLAELAVFNRRHDEDELASAEIYLLSKWGLVDFVKSNVNGAELALGPGGTFDCGGTNRFFAAVSGGGRVVNGTLETSKLIYDFSAPGALTVEGTFRAVQPFTVEIAGYDPGVTPAGSEVTVLNADNLDWLPSDGVEITVNGLPGGDTVRLRRTVDGALKLKFPLPGMRIIVR